MKVLLKALRNAEDLTRIFSFCEAHGIETLHDGSPLGLDIIQLEGDHGVVNWGGYGSAFSIGSNCFNYFSLSYPQGNPPRGKTFTYVKMVISGKLTDHDVEDVVERVEKLGGSVVQDISDTVNLLVVGKQADAKLVKKAENLNQVLILDEERFGEILPAKRKAPAKRAKSVAVPETIGRRELSNLKKLIISRDMDRIDQGIQLLRSLGNNDIFSYFLTDCDVTEGQLVRNKMFSGTGPAQPYLDYALLNVIAYAPDDCELAVTLRKATATLSMELSSTKPLGAFKNLETLNLGGSTLLESVDGLADLAKLTSIDLREAGFSSLPSGLDKIPNLTHLDLNGCGSLENVDGLADCTKLTKLNLSNMDNLEDVDALINLTNLASLDLRSSGRNLSVEPTMKAMTTRKQVAEYQDKIRLAVALRDGDTEVLSKYRNRTSLDLSECSSLQNVDGLASLTKLTSLNLGGCSSLQNVDGLASLTKLTDLFLSNCNSLENVDGLASLTKINSLDLSGCRSLQNVDGLASLTNLTSLNLRGCRSQNVDGLASLTNLTSLDLSWCNVQNVDGLANLTRLISLDLSHCSSLSVLPEKRSLTTRKQVAEYQDKIRLAVALTDGDTEVLSGYRNRTSLDLSGCRFLQNVDALINLTNLASLDLNSCRSLQNVDGLADCTKLTSLNLPNCNSLQNVDGLASCTNLTSLDLRSCSSLENVDGLASLTKITSLDLSGASFASLPVGLEKIPNLTSLDLISCSSLRNVDGLSSCTNLTNLDFSGSKNVRPRPVPEKLITRSQVASYQMRVMKKAGMEIPASFDTTSGSAKLTKEDKKYIANIKKFLKQRDFGSIDNGVELARSLDNPAVFEEFLKDCAIDKEGQLVRNRMFSGTAPAQPYLDYALLNLVAYAPEKTSLDESLKRSNIKSLDLSGTDVWAKLPSGISSFTNLTNLNLSSSNLQSVDALINLTRLTSLDLGSCGALQNVNGLAKCTNLTNLNLSRSNLQNVDGLASLTNLTSLGLSSCWELRNVNGLANLTNLTSLNLSRCGSLQNVDGLASLTNLTSLDLRSCDALQNVDGLASLTNLTSLDLSWCESLQNVDGLASCTKLSSLDLNYCKSLQNMDGLASLTRLTSLDLRGWERVEPAPRKYSMTSRKQVAAYQERIKKAMK